MQGPFPALVLSFAIASSASAATLTVTPDATTYEVGDTITLSVSGDPMGETDVGLFGRILFTQSVATYVSSSQTPVISEFGLPFDTSPLDGGDGFADVFRQLSPDNSGSPGLSPLVAIVTLQAASQGALNYEWLTDGPDNDLNLDFFSVTDAPGGQVLIVPEPSTAKLLALGALLWCSAMSRSRASDPSCAGALESVGGL